MSTFPRPPSPYRTRDLGDGIRVRELTGAGSMELQAEPDNTRRLAIVAYRCATDADGARYWASADDALDAPVRLLKAISEAVIELSGLGEDVEGN
jgi:hypothetical protein